MDKVASVKLLTKIAARDRAVVLLTKQAALIKCAQTGASWQDTLKGYADKFGNWLIDQEGWKDLALGAGAATVAGITANGLQGKKKNPYVTTLAALAAGIPTVYWGKDIRNFASQQWNKWFPQQQPQQPPQQQTS